MLRRDGVQVGSDGLSGVDLALQAARSALIAGRLDEAEAACQGVLAADPVCAEAHLLSAVVWSRRGRPDRAEQHYRSVLSADPTSFEATIGMAGVLMNRREEIEAVDFAKRAIELRPDDGTGYSILGRILLGQQKFAEAAEYLGRAVALEPDQAIPHHLLGQALEGLERNDEAQAEFVAATQIAPNVPEFLIALGQFRWKFMDMREASAWFRRAYKLEPLTARGQIQLAKALIQEGDLEKAERALRKSIAFDSKGAIAHALLGQVLRQLGRFEDASLELQTAIDLDPNHTRPYLNLVQCRKATEATRPLLDQIESQLARPNLKDDDLRYLHYALGKAYDDLGEYGRAIEHFDAANDSMRRLIRMKQDPRANSDLLDSQIAQMTPEQFQLGRSTANLSDRPIFIVGMIRSGTTLVEQIVSSHPEVGSGGELPYWLDRMSDALYTRGAGVEVSRLRAVADAYLSVTVERFPMASRVTDKMPLNFSILGTIHLALPNARLIHVRRSPIDNCLSIYLTPFPHPVNFGHSRESIVAYYEEYLRVMEHWRSTIPSNRLLEVDYEDLVADRERVTRRMIDFVGLDWDDACLRPEANERAVTTPSQWQVRQPVYRSSVDRWRNYEPWLGSLARLRPGG